MAHELVKLLSDDDKEPYDDPKWCVVDPLNTDPATLCTGEYFGEGQSDCTYETKTVKRGGITCNRCLAKLRWAKGVKL